jgi:hypothetical protein
MHKHNELERNVIAEESQAQQFANAFLPAKQAAVELSIFLSFFQTTTLPNTTSICING